VIARGRGGGRGGLLRLQQLVELLGQLGLLVPEARALAAGVGAAPERAVELVEEAAVGAAEVRDLRPQLAELPLLAHARPPRRLPVRHHPPTPALLVGRRRHRHRVQLVVSARAVGARARQAGRPIVAGEVGCGFPDDGVKLKASRVAAAIDDG